MTTLKERIAKIAKIAHPYISPYEDLGEIQADERKMAEKCCKVITQQQEAIQIMREALNQARKGFCFYAGKNHLYSLQELDGSISTQVYEEGERANEELLKLDEFLEKTNKILEE